MARMSDKQRRRMETARHNRAAMDRIAAERKAAGTCRHCGGPVPCSSPWGDVRVGVRHPRSA